MAITIEDLRLRITAEEKNIKQAQKNLKELKKQADEIDGKVVKVEAKSEGFDKATGYMKDLTLAMNPVQLGAAAVGAAVLAMATNAINAADQIQDLADATGQSTGSLMNLKQSIIEAGGSAEDFSKIATKLSVTTGDAMKGNKEAQQSFKDLGVYVTDSSGKLRDQDEIMQDVIRQLGAIEDPAVRSAKAYDMLGKAAAKIDWTKVNAAKDAIKEADIQRIADMRGELDKLYNTIENSLIGAFGRLAKSINEAFPSNLDARIARLNKSLRDLENRGEGNSLAAKLQRSQLEDAEKELQAKKDTNAETNKLAKLSATRTAPPKTGGYGKTPESTGGGGGGSTSKPVDQAAQYVESIRTQIQSVQKLSEVEKLQEDLENKRYGKLTQAQEKAMMDAAKMKDQAVANAKAQEEEIKRVNKEWADADKAFEEDEKKVKKDEETAKAIGQQIALERQLFDIKEGGLDQLERLRNATGVDAELDRTLTQLKIDNAMKVATLRAQLAGNITEVERAAIQERIRMENEAYANRVNREITRVEEQKTRDSDYMLGFQTKMQELTQTMTPFQMAGQAATTAFGAIDSAIDQLVTNGKASFSDLARSIIKNLTKMILQQMAFNAVAGIMKGFGGGVGPSAGDFFGGADFPIGKRATGGSVSGNKPYMVGEKGPELFIPGGNGTVIPNRNLGGEDKPAVTNVQTINVSAIDGQSVAKFFFENKQLVMMSNMAAQKERR